MYLGVDVAGWVCGRVLAFHVKGHDYTCIRGSKNNNGATQALTRPEACWTSGQLRRGEDWLLYTPIKYCECSSGGQAVVVEAQVGGGLAAPCLPVDGGHGD